MELRDRSGEYGEPPLSLAIKLNRVLDELVHLKKTSSEGTKKKSVHEMSESELREKISRMNLEKQYKSLYKELHPKQITTGEKFVKSASSILGDSVKNIAGQTATYVMGQEMNKLLRKAYPDDNQPINPKKGQTEKKGK